jgi:FkbM family methyltransferase
MSLAEMGRKVAQKGASGTLEAGSRRLRSSLKTSIARGVTAALRLLPEDVRLAVKTSTIPVTRLDYEGADIVLAVDSAVDFMRAAACRKEPGTVRWIESSVRAGDVFYDIGANVGAYSMVAASQAPPHVVVHAFEPSFSTYHQLCNNVILNGLERSVFPHLIAIGAAKGVSTLNYQSLVAGTSLHTVGAKIDFRGKEFEPVYEQRVLVFGLDDLVFDWGFDMPNHVKIDVDGTELDVLRGARRVLADDRLRTVLIEICHDRGETRAIKDLLAASGLTLASEDVLQPTVTNCVFVRATSS